MCELSASMIKDEEIRQFIREHKEEVFCLEKEDISYEEFLLQVENILFCVRDVFNLNVYKSKADCLYRVQAELRLGDENVKSHDKVMDIVFMIAREVCNKDCEFDKGFDLKKISEKLKREAYRSLIGKKNSILIL